MKIGRGIEMEIDEKLIERYLERKEKRIFIMDIIYRSVILLVGVILMFEIVSGG